MSRAEERARAIETTVADIRALEKQGGVNRETLERIKARLMQLAARGDLFAPADFPPPEPGGPRNSCIYRIAEDADRRFALYVNSSLGGYGTPAHNHTTWAVIVGIRGEELNRLYERDPAGAARENGQYVVRAGTGIAFMPDDLHSIHMEAPILNFHMYGVALEELHAREYYKPETKTWQVFPAHSDIREARAGRAR